MSYNVETINKNGIETNEMFYKFHNNFIRKTEEITPYYFEPTQEGQLDYMVYVALLYISNNEGEFDVRINKLVTSIGYTPKSGAGKINDKVKQSLLRLQKRCLLEIDEMEKIYVSGVVIIPQINERFFKLYENNIKFILNDLSSRFNEGDEAISKYDDKGKAMYVYSYLLSMMSKKATTDITSEDNYPTLCYPSYDNITENCDISRNYLNKLLAYFEYDGLIHTINIGNVTNEHSEAITNTSNYYTDNISDVYQTYTYAKAYYENKEYKVQDVRTTKRKHLENIERMMEQAKDKLSDKDYLKFREHTVLKIKNIILDFEKNNVIPRDYVNNYVASKKYLLSIYNRTEKVKRNPNLIAIADHNNGHLLLSNIEHSIKALLYIYKIIK